MVSLYMYLFIHYSQLDLYFTFVYRQKLLYLYVLATVICMDLYFTFVYRQKLLYLYVLATVICIIHIRNTRLLQVIRNNILQM